MPSTTSPAARTRALTAIAPALVALLAYRAVPEPGPSPAGTARCTLQPGTTRALVQIDQDTLLPLVGAQVSATSFSRLPARPGDPELATADTPMPSARVRITRLDPATRAQLRAEGINTPEPVAYLQARPYGADCSTIVWRDTAPWVRRGDDGYVVARLAPRRFWVGGAPVFVVSETWQYPYPARRGLLGIAALDPVALQGPLSSAAAMFDFEEQMGPVRDVLGYGSNDSSGGTRAIAFARSHPDDSERQPLRDLIRESVLRPEFARVRTLTSRFRGTWQVRLTTGDSSVTYWFRTPRQAFSAWQAADSGRSTADILRNPFVGGYVLLGYPAPVRDSLPPANDSTRRPPGGLWLSVADRPGMPSNERQERIAMQLEFRLRTVPAWVWPVLDDYPRLRSRADSIFSARVRSRSVVPRADQQAQFPMITLRRGAGDVYSADTTFVRNQRTLRLTVTRVDSLSIRNTF